MLYENEVQQISILGSSICNLSCSYCYLHNQETKSFYNLLNEEVQEGWKTGSYVSNIKEVFSKINANPLRTTRMEIWGGEPLIQIENLLISIKDLFSFFPNINFLMIPTNFAWPEHITNKIPQLILDYDNTRNGENNEFHLQLSIDSYKGILLEEGHKTNNQQYLKNFEVLIKGLSKIELTKSKVIIDIHPTASGQNILQHLYEDKDIQEYLEGMFFLKRYTDELIDKYNCQNKIVYGELPYFPLCAVPENSSAKDGYKYVSVLKNAELIEERYQYLKNPLYHYFGSFAHNYFNNTFYDANRECSESNANALMILPDGTISECACSYVANRKELLDLLIKNKQYEEYREALTRKKYFFNPLNYTKEEEEFNDWYNLTGLRNNYSTALNLNMSLCQELALSKQISWIYATNPMLLLKHLKKESSPYSCTREQFAVTGLPFLGHQGDYRRIFNGELEYVDSIIRAEHELVIKDWVINNDGLE